MLLLYKLLAFHSSHVSCADLFTTNRQFRKGEQFRSLALENSHAKHCSLVNTETQPPEEAYLKVKGMFLGFQHLRILRIVWEGRRVERNKARRVSEL